MTARIFKQRPQRAAAPLTCGRFLLALAATVGMSAAFGATSAAAGLLVPRSETTEAITPHVAAPPAAPAESEPSAAAYSATPAAPRPTWGVQTAAERRRASRHRRRRHRARMLRRLTQLEAEGSCDSSWGMTEECGDEGGEGGGDGSGSGSGSAGGEGGSLGSGGSTGSGSSGTSGSTDSGSTVGGTCPPLTICWEEPGLTDTSGSTDPGSTDTSGSTDTGIPADPTGPTDTSSQPEPAPAPEPSSEPQPSPKRQPDPGSTAAPIHLQLGSAEGTNCGIGYVVLGRKDVPGAPGGLGPGTTRVECAGDPELIPICAAPAADGSCRDGQVGPLSQSQSPPPTLGEFLRAQNACIGLQESEEELRSLEEIAGDFSVDPDALGLPTRRALNQAKWTASKCDSVWQGYR